MVKLKNTTKAWKTDVFESILIREVTDLGVDELPLQQGLSSSSVALDHQLKIIVLSVKSEERMAIIKMGAFYTGTIAGCNCADDPTPTDEINEYCEFITNLNLDNGEAEFILSAQDG